MYKNNNKKLHVTTKHQVKKNINTNIIEERKKSRKISAIIKDY